MEEIIKTKKYIKNDRRKDERWRKKQRNTLEMIEDKRKDGEKIKETHKKW